MPTPDADIPVAQPVRKAPTVSRALPAGKKFPCPQCGARLDFDPSLGELACPFCGHKEAVVHDDAAEVVERDYFAYLDKQKDAGGIQSIAGHQSQTQCTGCGATVLLEDNIVTDQCPFCHTHLENKPEKVEGLIEPESVLPFEVDLRGAREKFSRWLEGLWFAPRELTKIANLGQLTGVYVPYWTYDTMTYSRYSGDRGDNYTTYETYTVTDKDGNSRTETRPVVQIAWTSVSGEVQHFFDDVLVCGSSSLPEQLVDDLEPWDLAKLEPFKPDYLSGFKTERYAVGLQDGMKNVKKIIEPEILSLIRQDIGGDHQRIGDKKTKYSAITFKHTLFPVWVAVYRYDEKVYQILVNGRTGKVVGKRPWSKFKIARLVVGILLAILIILLIAGAFNSRKSAGSGPRRGGRVEVLTAPSAPVRSTGEFRRWPRPWRVAPS